MGVRGDTARPIHYGVNLVFAPQPELASSKCLQFEERLAEPVRGLTFEQRQRAPNAQGLQLTKPGNALVVGIRILKPNLGQLLVTSTPSGETQLDDFVRDASFVLDAYREVWPGAMTTLQRDCTIRQLYSTDGGAHAFQYLWEERLAQRTAAIEVFGRPVLGGGLRFVFPPREGIADDHAVETKIESFLRDPRSLFVETQAVWHTPLNSENAPDIARLLECTREFADGPVRKFIVTESVHE